MRNKKPIRQHKRKSAGIYGEYNKFLIKNPTKYYLFAYLLWWSADGFY